MGVDIFGVFNHNLSIEEAVNLPKQIDSWEDIKKLKLELKSVHNIDHNFSKTANWIAQNEINSSSLSTLWDAIESGTAFGAKIAGIDNIIECFLGWIRIYRHSICIVNWPEHKYANIFDPETAMKIFTINRAIAKKFNASKILYYPDSAIPTAWLGDYIEEGKTVDEVIRIGIELFGIPPSNLDDGRSYMFFIDNINNEIGSMTEINAWDKYWKYDETIEDYINPKTNMKIIR